MHKFLAPRLPAVVGLVLVVAGCGGAAPNGTAPPPSSAPSALECETEAFPCTFADVPDDVRAETERLATEVSTKIADGATHDELVAWLDSQASVAEVEGDADAVRFRPAGGRAVWLDLAGRAPQAAIRSHGRAIAVAGAWDSASSIRRIDESIAGPGRLERSALVLSPYRWDFGDADDGRTVAEQLGAITDYANRVTYAENVSSSASDVSVDDFQGWHGLQVIHVATHGLRLCANGSCRAVIAAHSIPNGLADLANSTVRGLEIEVVVGPPGPAQTMHHVLLGADFFRAEYPRGVDDAVIFLNGCATFGAGATDLADAIRGQTSIVLGWSRAVATEAAFAAGVEMFNELGGNARTVDDALTELGPTATSQFQNRAGQSVVATLTSSGRAAGGDLRIRELITFSNDAGSGPLGEGSDVPIIGQADDGVADSVGWHVRVDGIQREAASALLHVAIDGHQAAPVAVSSGVSAGPNSWDVSGIVDLGFDVSAPHPAQFEASLDLPEGGQSNDSVSAVLVGDSPEPTSAPEPLMGSVWRGHVTDRLEVKPGHWRTAEADLVFTLKPGSVRYLNYELTGGTMYFSWSGSDSDCTTALAPVEVPVTPENSSGGFRIDTGSSPPLFDGWVDIQGPEVEVMQTCTGEYAYLTGPFGTRAQAVFIQVYSGEEPLVPVVGDRVTGKSLYGDSTFDISRSE